MKGKTGSLDACKLRMGAFRSRTRRILKSYLSDRLYSVLLYRRHMGRLPNLKKPTTFNEKLLWLKLNYRDPVMRDCSDKLGVREYVRRAVGEKYLIPLLGVYRTPGEIPFESLPNQFVLKTNHGCGWNILCRDKGVLDIPSARKRLKDWLETDYYTLGREWVYKDIEPFILCEELLLNENHQPPWDYKLFCFRGVPRLVELIYDRHADRSVSYYDMTWRRTPFTKGYPQFKPNSLLTPRPACFDEMVRVSRELSRSFPFVRVDLYEHRNRVLFGELTFLPSNATAAFSPELYEREFGNYINLDLIEPSCRK